MKKRMGVILLLLGVVIAAIVILVAANGSSLKLTVDGLKISEEEYLDIMQGEIYEVTRYFYETYGAAVDGEFWEKDFQGEVPYEMLAENTLEQLKYNHGVYAHAKEMGYISSASYEALLERVAAENAARKERMEKGEPVYGLSEYTKEIYMEYEMDSFQKLYCDNIENEGMEISEEERRAYYEEYKDALFVAHDDIKLNYIRVSYETEEEAEELKKILTNLYKSMDQENSMESLVNGEYSQLKEFFVSLDIPSGEYTGYLKTIPEILEYAAELEAGESTQMIEEGTGFCLVECVERVEHDYRPIEEVKDNINKTLRESVYDSMMQQRAEQVPMDFDRNQIYDFTKKNIIN